MEQNDMKIINLSWRGFHKMLCETQHTYTYIITNLSYVTQAYNAIIIVSNI